MQFRRLIPIWVPLAIAAVPAGCGGGSTDVENQVSPNGLTPKQQQVTKQMADFEASQKAGNAAPK